MAREFNINFNNVEMIDDMDNFLEELQITKVTFEGENKLKSLKSTFKNCPQLSEVGDIDLSEIEAIDCMIEGSQPIIHLTNVNNVNLTFENSLTTAKSIVIKGDSYNKIALQNILGSLDWQSKQYIFEGTVGEDIFEVSKVVEDINMVTVKDSLEQRTTEFEILGQAYNNEIKGKEKVKLEDDVVFEISDSNNEMSHTEKRPINVEIIEGETYQNLVNGRIGGALQDYYSYTIDPFNNVLDDKIEKVVKVIEIQGDTIENLNATENKIFNTTPKWSKEITESDNSFTINQPIVEITEIWGNTKNIDGTLYSVGELYVDKLGDPILNENGDFQYLLGIEVEDSDTVNLLLPQPLRGIEDTRDRIYWDYKEECYYLEKNLDESLTVLIVPTITKLSKLNKIRLKTQPTNNINVSCRVYPQKIILTNKQSIASVSKLVSNTQYSVHLKALGGTEENTITQTDLSLLSWALGDYSNTSISDITLSNTISINTNKGVTNSSCSIDFSKLFDTLTFGNFQFSCDFRVNSLSSNSDRAIIIQGGCDYEGFEIKGRVLNATTGHLTVTYDYSSKTCSVVSSGAMPIESNNIPFEENNIENSFKIITQNCNIIYANISLTTDNGVCIGEGENKIPILASLKVDLGGTSKIIKPTFIDGYKGYAIPITTSTISNNYLELTGNGIHIKDISVTEGLYNDYQEYFEGTQSIGTTLKDEYLIELSSNNYDVAWEKL